MKIAIHKRKGSFSDRWIQYCIKYKITYKLVDCYSTRIIEELKDCDGLLWHWNQNDYKAALCARQITKSVEETGKKVFPNSNSSWHFDDKVGQKYLLEAIDAPTVNSYVFYTKKEAIDWLRLTEFPKVFKLRGGAGSVNVKLVKNYKSGCNLIRKAFSTGFSPIDKSAYVKDRFRDFKRLRNKESFIGIFKSFGRVLIPKDFIKYASNEKGYVYFQDFIPKNDFDTRLIVVGNRCFGVRRYCRANDFRASGSGVKAYNKELFDINMVKIAFDTANKIGSQSLAFDFITDQGTPKIIELSYCYLMGDFYDNCHGYWDNNLVWHKENINPQNFIIEDFINSVKSK
jgi:glutathione synthase/RimK-type ligase-like ATP-grasp enzyme